MNEVRCTNPECKRKIMPEQGSTAMSVYRCPDCGMIFMRWQGEQPIVVSIASGGNHEHNGNTAHVRA